MRYNVRLLQWLHPFLQNIHNKRHLHSAMGGRGVDMPTVPQTAEYFRRNATAQ